MTNYLDLEDVLVCLVRNDFLVKDAGLLESAIQRPRTSLFGQDAYPDLALKAAALLHSIAQNQALVDGNKRLALLCTHAFLRLNGHRLGAEDGELFDLMMEMAAGLTDLRAIAERLAIRRAGTDASAGTATLR